MAKKRVVIGSLCSATEEDKAKGFPNYIKIRDDVTLKKGDFIRAESKAFQTKSLENAVKDGKLSEEVSVSIKQRIEKIPEWVIAELVVLREQG